MQGCCRRRKIHFEEVYASWTEKQLTQEDAARILGVSDRTFRCYLLRYEESRIEGLIDKRFDPSSFAIDKLEPKVTML